VNKLWKEVDNYMIYNEITKQVIIWQTYGENPTYFLSQEYYYNNDFLEENDNDRYTLINEEITKDNTVKEMIERTKNMA
jgi:hypothetical protein